MKFDITEQETNRARHPHEYFLINLITNHVLIFMITLGMASSYPWLMLVTPTISITILGYLIWRARVSRVRDSWFVYCHWQLCARHSLFLIGVLVLLVLVVISLILSVGGELSHLRPGHYAIGGVVILPTLFSMLALIIMESDALHRARNGELPEWLVQRYPNPGTLPRQQGE